MSHEFQNLGIEAIADILGTELPGRAGQQGENEEKNIWEVSMETMSVDTPCIFSLDIWPFLNVKHLCSVTLLADFKQKISSSNPLTALLNKAEYHPNSRLWTKRRKRRK